MGYHSRYRPTSPRPCSSFRGLKPGGGASLRGYPGWTPRHVAIMHFQRWWLGSLYSRGDSNPQTRYFEYRGSPLAYGSLWLVGESNPAPSCAHNVGGVHAGLVASRALLALLRSRCPAGATPALPDLRIGWLKGRLRPANRPCADSNRSPLHAGAFQPLSDS